MVRKSVSAENIDQWQTDWCDRVDGKPVLLVKRLRSLGLEDVVIVAVLHTISSTCKHCWDADTAGWKRCCCAMDD